MEYSGASWDGTAPEVALDLRTPQPFAHFLKSRKGVLDPGEGRRPLALGPIFNQFRRPDRIATPRSAAHDAADDLVRKEKVIGSGCELNEALAHAGPLPGWSSLSIHSWTIAITASRSGAMNKVGRCFGNATKAIQSTPVWLSLI